MEEMIERWRWCERIEARLMEMDSARLLPRRHNHPLSTNNVKEIAARLLECVKAVMCKGQSRVAVTDLKAEAGRVVLPLLHRSFLQALGAADRRMVSALVHVRVH